MTDQPVDGEPAGQNVAGEVPAAEPEAVTDETTVHDDDIELNGTHADHSRNLSGEAGKRLFTLCTGRELNPDRWLGRPKSYH